MGKETVREGFFFFLDRRGRIWLHKSCNQVQMKYMHEFPQVLEPILLSQKGGKTVRKIKEDSAKAGRYNLQEKLFEGVKSALN